MLKKKNVKYRKRVKNQNINCYYEYWEDKKKI